jgi:hypothetical protein
MIEDERRAAGRGWRRRRMGADQLVPLTTRVEKELKLGVPVKRMKRRYRGYRGPRRYKV